MKRKYILLLLILTFQNMKKNGYWKYFGNIGNLLVILWMILKALVLFYVSIQLILSPMPSLWLIINAD